LRDAEGMGVRSAACGNMRSEFLQKYMEVIEASAI
jgi:hypothetical protein